MSLLAAGADTQITFRVRPSLQGLVHVRELAGEDERSISQAPPSRVFLSLPSKDRTPLLVVGPCCDSATIARQIVILRLIRQPP